MQNAATRITAGLLLILTAQSLCAQTPNAEPAPTRQEIIDALDLIPMTDDACIGYYKECYESTTQADTTPPRPAASSIYYLMSGGLFDPWHQFEGDEILVYHAGAPMNQMLIYPDGSFKTFVLGPDPRKGHQPQILIPAGAWMGFRIATDDPNAWGLYSVFCSPAFRLEAISMTNGPDLAAQYPEATETMKKLRMYE